ncbi:MAG: hypothetical protein GX613_14970 [Chloroflexi bacterium]|nr:hypothetical protein [Chloroflexota bacterium]
MDRFPMLTTYKALLNGVAILTLAAGLFVAIDAARETVWGETEFQFGVFLLTFIPFGIGAFMLAVSAELITLFLTIEDRLYEIQNNTSPKRSAPQTASRPAPSKSATQTNATAGASEETVYPAASRTAARKVLATVTASDRTLVHQRPNKMAPPHRIAVFGEDVTLVARTEDCAWMKIEASYNGWIAAAALTLHGDVYDLPVVSE